MPGLIVAIAGLALLASLIALGAGWATLNDHERRITNPEAENNEQARGSRHDRLGRDHHDIGEAFLFDLTSMGEEVDALKRKLNYFARRAAHVAQGGKPDDDPREWKS